MRYRLFLLFSLLLDWRCDAQSIPKLQTLSREWFQRGTTNELTISGENLSKVRQVAVSESSGISVSVNSIPNLFPGAKIEATRGGITIDQTPKSTQLKVTLVVSADAPLISREIRVITALGVSNPLRIYISSTPEILEQHPEEQAQEVTLPVGISGTILHPAEQDTYRFRAKKDEVLIIDPWAFRLNSPLDTSLSIEDSTGKEIARSEDARGFDSFLNFHVTDDGDYTVRLRDFRYGGGSDHKYHLVLGAIPYVESFFPAGAERGHSTEIHLAGANLQGFEKLVLVPDKNAPIGWQELMVGSKDPLSAPFPFEISDLAERTEEEPNNDLNHANRISPPIVVNGRIQQPRDVDFFRLKAQRSERIVCEVSAQRFGSMLDALLTLSDSDGKILQQNDDSVGADARVEFNAEKDHEYLLSIRDLLDRGGNNFTYRLSIRPPKPDFSVRFSPDTPRLRCGGRTVLTCEVTRKAGFAGAVQVMCTNLPSGVTASSLLLTPEGPNSGLIFLESSDQTDSGSHSFSILATAAINGTRETRRAEPIDNDQFRAEAFVTVLATLPLFRLEMTSLSLGLLQDSSGDVEFAIHRRPGFAGDIKVTAEGYASGRENIGRNLEVESVTLKPSESKGVLRLKARPDSEIGTRLIFLRGESVIDGIPESEYSDSIPLSIQQIPFILQNTMKRLSMAVLPPGSKSAAGEAEFAIRASRRGWFTDQIQLSLEGLPKGIVASLTNLSANVGEVICKLNATEKAVIGQETEMTVIGSVTIGGRTYQQKTAPMKISVTRPQELAEGQ